ncbi:5603_t:CDS:2 [Funneliformis mosseae]|uniref:5603_t:CDS:1 n=1 Tax=Funneliformis mosseae TaxID=27381 RepID=A0A9N9GMH9_FUNMO|nr:5603_t:CDS:2 [Funneliformis mosseae]
MPKNLKQTKNKRIKPFIIGSNNVENNSVLNIETNISSSNIVLSELKLKFPPILTTDELIKNAIKSNTSSKVKTLPNAFIAYRMALIKEYHKNNIKLPPMGQFSKITKQSWDKETENVKDFYIKLAKDAKSLYMKNKTIQLVFDRHMSDSQITTGDSEYYVNHTGALSLENSTVCVTNSSETSIEDNSSNNLSINIKPTLTQMNSSKMPLNQTHHKKLEQECFQTVLSLN